MKIAPFLPIVLLLTVGFSQAAPRLVVSTPSLAPDSKIDVIFEQPVVSQESLGKETENKLITTKPPLPGKLFWKAPTIAEYRPDAIPALGTDYEFSMVKGAKHLDGSAIGEGAFATARTEAFRIHTSQIPNRWSEEYSHSTAGWLIVFNDDVDPAAVAGFFAFSSAGGQRVAPKVEWATAQGAGYYRIPHMGEPRRSREAAGGSALGNTRQKHPSGYSGFAAAGWEIMGTAPAQRPAERREKHEAGRGFVLRHRRCGAVPDQQCHTAGFLGVAALD
jgi:hypothetical protein